jgi:chitosanase
MTLSMGVQEEMFDKLYLGPAFQWAAKCGFYTAAFYLVIADSFLHSGSMLSFLMNRVRGRKPSDGGDEEAWILAYTGARRDWLANHSHTILRNTVYRCDCYLDEMQRNNWNLAKAPSICTGRSSLCLKLEIKEWDAIEVKALWTTHRSPTATLRLRGWI